MTPRQPRSTQKRNKKKTAQSKRARRPNANQARKAHSNRQSKQQTSPESPHNENEADQASVLMLFNKPFQVLCQFTDSEGRQTLADYIEHKSLYAAGRLDRDSEGLLLLTNNGMLQHRIAHPEFKLAKTYLAQVEGEISEKALRQLREGIRLPDGPTAPAEATREEAPDWLWERTPPIRYRKDKPTSWLRLVITEGRNRQVRRMTAAVGYPTLRLIRSHIGRHSVTTLQPGEHEIIQQALL